MGRILIVYFSENENTKIKTSYTVACIRESTGDPLLFRGVRRVKIVLPSLEFIIVLRLVEYFSTICLIVTIADHFYKLFEKRFFTGFRL